MRAPLRYRLANPPSAFLGRDAELGLVRAALERGALVVVCGGAGLGKSALVQASLRDAPGVRVLRCLPSHTFGALGRDLLLALGHEPHGERAEDDALLDAVLAAAESAESTVVLEDLHVLPEATATRWLLGLAQYSRDARWVVTSRSSPALPGLEEQVVHLRALDAAAARALAEACAAPCTVAQLDAIVDAAGGSPQRIRELAVSLAGAATLPPSRAKLGELEAVLHAGDVDHAEPALRVPERDAGAALGARVQRLLDEDAHDTTRPLGLRGTVFTGMRLIAEGRSSRGKLILRALQESADLPSGLSLLASVSQGLLRVTGGRYTGLTLLSRELVREAEHLGNATLYHWAFMLERLVSLSASVSSPEPPWPLGLPTPTGISERYLLAVRVAHRARRGEHIPDAQLPRTQPGDGPLAACVCAFLETHVCLLRGDAERAEVVAATLVRRCVELRVLVVQGEALLMLCYAQLALGREDELRASVDALARVGRSARSRRYTVIADLLRLALHTAPNAGRLLKIAGLGDASPTAARVADALLGGATPDDALDRLLIDGLAARWRARVHPLHVGEAAEWVFDPTAGTVFIGHRAEQASPLAIRILCCLFDASSAPPGYARLEDIARVVWDVSDYHPLRDAKRVHVAIRRLRTLIEDDSSAPSRLVTVDGGYRLSHAARPGRLAPCA